MTRRGDWRAAGPEAVRRIDRWVKAVPLVGALHLSVLATVYSRPGAVAILLWYIGPAVIAALTALLLAQSLLSSRRWRTGVHLSHLAGYAGLVLIILTLPIYDPYPSSRDDEPSAVPFRVPLDGAVTVAWGGADGETNYHVYLPDQRWAYDLLVTRDGRSFQNDGTRLEDYYCYEHVVRAPAAGHVFAVHDGEPDVPIGARRWGLAGLGNHVVLQVAPGEFLFIGHLQPGSVAVRAGDWVFTGQPLGRVGNSGNSSEPHVHLHLQDTAQHFFGEAIPFYFHRYWHDGEIVERGMPRGGRDDDTYLGQVVTHAAGRVASP